MGTIVVTRVGGTSALIAELLSYTCNNVVAPQWRSCKASAAVLGVWSAYSSLPDTPSDVSPRKKQWFVLGMPD